MIKPKQRRRVRYEKKTHGYLMFGGGYGVPLGFRGGVAFDGGAD
jgi:hypothetical protein